MEFIFDGNALLHVATRQAISIFRKSYNLELKSVNDDTTPLTDFLKKEYKQVILNYMNTSISPFYSIINHIHFVMDNISWRKEYLIKFFERNPTHNSFKYKGKRKPDKDVKLLNKFFENFHDEILPILKQIPGFYAYSTIGAEGDDIIAFLVDKFPNNDIAIWTGDQDIGQLAIDTSRMVFLLGPRHITSKKRRVSVIEDKKVMNFNYNAQLNESIANLLRNNYYEKIILHPGKVALSKVVARDVSDNIGSIYVRYNAKKEPINITEKRANRFLQPIFDKYDDATILKNLDNLNEDFYNEILEILIAEFKIKREPENEFKELTDKIKKNYARNIKVIRLSKEQIPEILIAMINRVFEYHYNGVDFDYAAFAANIEERRTY